MKILSEHTGKDHGLARIDARVKLIVALVIIAMILSYKGFVLPVLVTALCMSLIVMMKIPARIFALRFSEPAFIVSIILLLKFFFSGNDALFSMDVMGFTLVGYRDGLMEGLQIGCRIMGAVSVVAVLGFSTPFTEFMAGLSWFRVPKGIIEIMMFAYRYIFVLLEDASVIYSAQKNRLGYSNVRRGLSSFGVLAGSLTLKAFDHSQSTTTAMMQRGYDGNMPLLQHQSFKLSEILASVLVMTAMGFIWKM